MKKIPTLFVRNPDDRRYVLNEVNPGCEWVIAGEGVATRKYDGTCVKLDDTGTWWARREVKPGKKTPAGFVPEQHDDVTGKTVGWEPIEQSPFVKFFIDDDDLDPGTYEFIGPKINGNPEGAEAHMLIRHAEADVLDAPRTYNLLRDWLRDAPYEGVVWHHPDGRMVKLKKRDFPA